PARNPSPAPSQKPRSRMRERPGNVHRTSRTPIRNLHRRQRPPRRNGTCRPGSPTPNARPTKRQTPKHRRLPLNFLGIIGFNQWAIAENRTTLSTNLAPARGTLFSRTRYETHVPSVFSYGVALSIN